MFSERGIKVAAENDLMEKLIEQEGHNQTYRLTVNFKNREDEHVGDLDIYFIVKGFGNDGDNEEIDVHFTVPFFSVHGLDGERFMEEAEAMQFIFINFASEIQNVIDQALDALYEQYEQKHY